MAEHGNDWLEQRLARSQPTLPDDGFSGKVMARIRPASTTTRLERNLLVGSAALGSAITALSLPFDQWSQQLQTLAGAALAQGFNGSEGLVLILALWAATMVLPAVWKPRL